MSDIPPLPAPLFDPNPQPLTPEPRREPPWGFRDLLEVLLFLLTTQLFLHLSGLAVLKRFAGHLDALDVRFILPVQMLTFLLTIGFVYFMIAVRYQAPFWTALHWHPVGQQAPLFLMAGVALAFASQLVPLLFPSGRHLPIEKLFKGPTSGYLLAAFGIGVAPFVEELLFRGVVYPVFERRWGLEPAVLSTAALFALIHVPQLGGAWPPVIAIFLVGVAFSYARGRSGSLVPSFLMHLSYNSTLFAALYLATNGFRKFS